MEAVNALTDPQRLKKEPAALERDPSDQLRRPAAALRNLACNIEQRGRKLKEGRPNDLIRAFLDAAAETAS